MFVLFVVNILVKEMIFMDVKLFKIVILIKLWDIVIYYAQIVFIHHHCHQNHHHINLLNLVSTQLNKTLRKQKT